MARPWLARSARGPAYRRRGTLRDPGPDLRKLPIGLDLTAISLTEGVRAAVASGAVLVANAWIGSPSLMLAAFAANFACFCDTGGPVRDRVPALLAFTLLGALLWSGLGLLHHAGAAVLLGCASLVVFCNSMARVWGVRAQAVGNVLTVVLALGLDRPLTGPQAAELFGAFLAGGSWATVLTVGIWRIYPDRPVARQLGATWGLLASLARDITRLLAEPRTGAPDWDGHARAHRRAVRDAIEATRASVVAALRPPGPMSPEAGRAMLMLEAQDGIFGTLIAISDIAAATEADAPRATLRRLTRRLRPILQSLGRDHTNRQGRLEPALRRLARDAADQPALRGVVDALQDRLRVADRIADETDAGARRAGPAPRAPAGGLRPLWTALAGNLTWQSAVLRHAVRAAVLIFVAVAITLAWPSPYGHWLTITVALTMQPYFAATWQRALERIAGTLIGAGIGGALAFVPQTQTVTAMLLIPLSVIGFSVRQVSYGAYVACLTPLTVLLFDLAEPGHSEWMVAAMRTLYTIGGGLVAVLACMVLWPSWEPDRTEAELRDTLRAHADFAEAIFAAGAGTATWDAAEEARRRAGIASNNLEASLSRALQEPRRKPSRRLESLLAADAAVRRIGGGLLALQHEARLGAPQPAEWGRWLAQSFRGIADRAGVTAPPPSASPNGTLARLGRGIELLDGIAAEIRADPAPGPRPSA